MNNSILKDIVTNKQYWINIQNKKIPIQTFKNYITLSTRKFYQALNKNQTVFILECKKASPSKGIICKNFDIVKISNVYKNYAHAISVLTDDKYFHGNFHFLREVSDTVKQPVLCKDFIISNWQIYFARLHKADAILLMLSILDDKTYQKLAITANNLNMGILTEVSNEKEWKRAINLKAKVIGINNRNLHNFSIDLQQTTKLIKNKPQKTIVISESGISSHQEIRQLCQYVNGFLIGSALTSKKDINQAVRKILLGENKICGLTRVIDAHTSYKAGALYGGLIFVPESPRFIDINKAYNIIHNVKSLYYVGVFRDASIDYIIKLVELLNLSSIQLHGKENIHYIKKLYSRLEKKCAIWKALNINNILLNTNKEKNLKEIKRYILDNGQGGTGKTFDWSLMKKISLRKKGCIILGGGLTITNCAKAIKLECAGLDFNSGIESSPGIKDHKKINTIFKILRNY